jgi:hypothetical protein
MLIIEALLSWSARRFPASAMLIRSAALWSAGPLARKRFAFLKRA